MFWPLISVEARWTSPSFTLRTTGLKFSLRGPTSGVITSINSSLKNSFPLRWVGRAMVAGTDGKLVESEFPFDEIEEKLLNWTVTYMLNQNQYRSNIVERINQGGYSAKG